MRVGSLFAGIGGLELGIESALDAETIWQVEIDPFCRQVLTKHWPEATRYDDIRGLTGLASVDIICGGFPCQDLSGANHRGGDGLAGAQSGLWFEMLRIIRECRPRFVVIENVSRLARRGLDVVVSGLVDEGFEVEATRIEAGMVGAPHHRERLLIVASHPDRDSEPVGAKHGKMARMCGSTTMVSREWRNVRMADGIPHRMDRRRMRALGNAVVPRVGAIAGARIAEVLHAL